MILPVRDAVEKALDEIRPSVQADGGEIELVAVEAGVVKVKLSAACQGCPGQAMTIAMMVEPMLKDRVPGVLSVIVVP
jgi:Fe-S cluster biogenesis protein NfuA